MRHDGAGCVDAYQSAARSDIVLPKVLSRRHLWMLRNEHRRREYSGLHNVIHCFIIEFLTLVNQAIEILNSFNLVFGNFDLILAWSKI